jgi:hypothetical protein
VPSKVIVVPGLAVRRYAEKPVERLRQAGYDTDLRPGLSWHGVPVDIADYRRELGAEISAAGEPVRRPVLVFRSAIRLPLEEVLGDVSAELTVVHGEYDHLTSYAYAALAANFGATVRLAPDGAHSWPIEDPEGFPGLVDDLVAVRG